MRRKRSRHRADLLRDLVDHLADLGFADAVRKVRTTLCLAPYDNETAQLCNWQVAGRHYLESWGDACAYDGTLSFIQPLIEPFFDAAVRVEDAAQVAVIFHVPRA